MAVEEVRARTVGRAQYRRLIEAYDCVVLFAKHSAHQVDPFLRAEFAHDVFAVKLDGARGDAKRLCSFLAGGSPHDYNAT